MKIVVCVKQVPEVTDVQIDPVTGSLLREGVRSILNPFCEYALDQAVRIARAHAGTEITVLTMGPLQARHVLLRSLELGADSGILVTGRSFAGSDSWATAQTLAAAIRFAVPDFNLVFTGRQAIDGDTAQVGPELAELLALPQITCGVETTLSPNHRKIQVKREFERGYEVIETRLPALVTFSKGETVRRAPSLQDLIDSRRKPIQLVGAEDLHLPAEELGLKGSFTQVVRVFPPVQKKSGEVVQNVDDQAAAERIFEFLRERRFIED